MATRLRVALAQVNLWVGDMAGNVDKLSQEARRAPLLLVPVELQRQDARDRIHLAHSGEDVGGNELSIRGEEQAVRVVRLEQMAGLVGAEAPGRLDLQPAFRNRRRNGITRNLRRDRCDSADRHDERDDEPRRFQHDSLPWKG